MRLGIGLDANQPLDAVVTSARAAKEAGFSSLWATQIFGTDTLTMIALVAQQVDGIEFGTAIIPIHPRHPQVLAQQALTVQSIADGRLTLGIGLSHRVMVEGLWCLSYDRPGTYMREYLDALLPMLRGEVVSIKGELVSAVTIGPVGPSVPPPSVIVAALGPVMLKMAGERTDGTVTWMTGIATLRDYVVPTIRAAAQDAGRPAPRVVASIPVCLTDDVATATEHINTSLAIYPTLPSYKAMLDKEGATGAADVGLIGSKDRIEAGFGELAEAGVTDAVVAPMGNKDEVAATVALAASHARG